MTPSHSAPGRRSPTPTYTPVHEPRHTGRNPREPGPLCQEERFPPAASPAPQDITPASRAASPPVDGHVLSNSSNADNQACFGESCLNITQQLDSASNVVSMPLFSKETDKKPMILHDTCTWRSTVLICSSFSTYITHKRRPYTPLLRKSSNVFFCTHQPGERRK